MTENKPAAKPQVLLDTKYGTIAPDSVTEHKSKTDKPYLTATLTTGGGKDVTVYAHGEKLMESLRAKADAGEPTFVTGELLAKGTGISASKFEPTVYTGKVVEIGKTGDNNGPWAVAKIQVEGKEKPMSVLVTGDEVERVKNAGDAEIKLDVVWTAGQVDGRWRSGAQTANGLKREPAAPKVEEPEAPGM